MSLERQVQSDSTCPGLCGIQADFGVPTKMNKSAIVLTIIFLWARKIRLIVLSAL
jgi:hypothetical protein